MSGDGDAVPATWFGSHMINARAGVMLDAEESARVVELVRRAQAGNTRAVEELIELYRPMMQRLAMRLLSGRADAEDAVQEALLAFVQHVGDIRSPERVGAWLRSVTANAARRVGRRSSRLDLGRPLTDLEAPETTEDEVKAHCLSDERRRTVREAIDRLNPFDRELLELLAAAERPSYVEIGRRLQRPVGSIGPTRRRVIARLRADPSVRELLAGV